MDYQAPCLVKSNCATNINDGIGGEKDLIKHVQNERSGSKSGNKYILLKHHYYVNFTNYETNPQGLDLRSHYFLNIN